MSEASRAARWDVSGRGNHLELHGVTYEDQVSVPVAGAFDGPALRGGAAVDQVLEITCSTTAVDVALKGDTYDNAQMGTIAAGAALAVRCPGGGVYDPATHSMVLPGGLGRLDCTTTRLHLAPLPPHRADCTRGVACYCPGGWLRHNLATLTRRLYATDAVPCVGGCPCPDRAFCSHHGRHRS